ncbi:MAG: hypothetical protein KC736_04975 [Candidatus Moranbacteria bacterium]|nr:hypothetical protein [Candidatus Moranbacteria bacterium]
MSLKKSLVSVLFSCLFLVGGNSALAESLPSLNGFRIGQAVLIDHVSTNSSGGTSQQQETIATGSAHAEVNVSPPYQGQIVHAVYYTGIVSQSTDGTYFLSFRLTRNNGRESITFNIPATYYKNSVCVGEDDDTFSVTVFNVNPATGYIDLDARWGCDIAYAIPVSNK